MSLSKGQENATVNLLIVEMPPAWGLAKAAVSSCFAREEQGLVKSNEQRG